jgi:methylglyoxal synthase
MNKITLALVAHDSKKDDMVQLVKANKDKLTGFNIVATRTTGRIIQDRTGLPVALMQSGPCGGDQQIGALVASGEVAAVIFLHDPLTAHPHEPDVSALLRVCDVHEVPLATNIASAQAVLQLLFEQPRALSEHRLTAEPIAEIATAH